MECPYLEAGSKSMVCSAAASLSRHSAPGIEDAGAYCTTEEHYRCPTLLGHILRGGCSPGSGKKGVAPLARIFSWQSENGK